MTRTAFVDRKRGIQWTFTTSLEDLDFADDLALLTHRIQDMKDKTRAKELWRQTWQRPIERPHVEETRLAYSQEGAGVEPTGGGEREGDPSSAYLATQENGHEAKGTDKIGLGNAV